MWNVGINSILTVTVIAVAQSSVYLGTKKAEWGAGDVKRDILDEIAKNK